jgi:hypothetical protein
MSRTAKVLLLVFLGCVVLLAGLGLLGAAWWDKNGEQFMGDAQDSLVEGQQYGLAAEAKTPCIDASMERLETCNGIMCGVQLQLFTQSCLTTAPDEAGFCDEVPEVTEIMASVTYQTKLCEQYGHERHQLCPGLGQAVQKYCSDPSQLANLP